MSNLAFKLAHITVRNPDSFDEFGIDCRQVRSFHPLQSNRKINRLFRQILTRVIRRESHFERFGLTRFHAYETRFKIRQHFSGAQHYRQIFGFAALKRLAVNFSGEIDIYPISGLNRAIHFFKRSALLAQSRNGVLHIGLGQFINQAFYRDAGQIADRNFRVHLESCAIFDLVGILVLGLDFKLRSSRHFQIIVF